MSVNELKQKGNEAAKAKRYDEAIKWYSKALDIDSNSETAGTLYSNRASCWQGLGNFANALSDAEHCIRISPSWIKGHFRKGLALEGMKKYDEALKSFQQAVTIEPENKELPLKVSQLMEVITNRNEKTTTASCKTVEDAKLIGDSFFSFAKFDSAIPFYSRAIELAGGDASLLSRCYANRAACYQQTRIYDKVVEDCTEALKVQPNYTKALYRRAVAYEALEKWKKALDDYTTLKTLSPGWSAVSSGIMRCKGVLEKIS